MVLVTIHQPSSQIYHIFDTLLLLSHGQVRTLGIHVCSEIRNNVFDLHHCVVLFFWAFGIMDCIYLHLTIEFRSSTSNGSSVFFSLMNSFNKTDAAIFPMQNMLPKDFPFSQIYQWKLLRFLPVSSKHNVIPNHLLIQGWLSVIICRKFRKKTLLSLIKYCQYVMSFIQM